MGPSILEAIGFLKARAVLLTRVEAVCKENGFTDDEFVFAKYAFNLSVPREEDFSTSALEDLNQVAETALEKIKAVKPMIEKVFKEMEDELLDAEYEFMHPKIP